MLILAFESSARAASAALLREGRLLAQSFQNSGLTHSRTLLPLAEDLLKNTGTALSDVQLIAVAAGPGSFTGVRIGVSVAKGLAWATNLPVCGVSTLEAMAFSGVFAPDGALVCPVMDARRDQVYNALFAMDGDRPQRLCPDRALSLSELRDDLRERGGPVYLVGDGAKLTFRYLADSGIPVLLAPDPVRLQSAWGVGMAALGKPAGDAFGLLPVYLRQSQAEREKSARDGAEGSR